MEHSYSHLRIGLGEDAHALASGRRLVIGGVLIPDSPHGPAAHSDGDVVLHALADALLGSLALGDIGHYFPPSDPGYKDLDSKLIVQRALELLRQQSPGVQLLNVSAVVTLDAPKLGDRRQRIQESVADLLGLSPTQVGFGFKTSEGLALRHIQARVSVLLDCK